ncbi:MAG: HD-GYP domain-containing protein [Hormoscilla sp.]
MDGLHLGTVFNQDDWHWIESERRAELIEQLLGVGTALSGSYNLGELLNLILQKSREITCSDAGSVYLIDGSDETHMLLFKAAQNDSLPAASFREFAMPISLKSLAGYVAITGESLNLPDAYNLPPEVPYQLDRNFDRDFSYRTCSVLVLPMQNQNGQIIGVLQLLNRKVRPEEIVTDKNALLVTQPYSQSEERIVRSLASMAAISIERNHLQESVENLFESFVKASIQLIEARDPITFGHSGRVAKLAVRLSQEVNDVTTGSMKAIQLSEHQIQQIRYASLLHDFGKLGIPEAILQKRKKLYPEQLEVIRHRFALAKRTLEMECDRAKFKHILEHPTHGGDRECQNCHQLEKLDTQVTQKIEQLNYYWDILLKVNEPESWENHSSEILIPEVEEQLRAISEYRYLDVDGQLKPLISPEEMAQLMITKGTLTPAERLAVEAHVTHSYEFLKRIPWTPHLQDIPIIAYGHHEKLDGSGYPRALKQPDIPIQTQIITIADIYDALAAPDRPYKDAFPVEMVLEIMRKEAAANKINSDLLDLFEQRQVYQVIGHS